MTLFIKSKIRHSSAQSVCNDVKILLDIADYSPFPAIAAMAEKKISSAIAAIIASDHVETKLQR